MVIKKGDNSDIKDPEAFAIDLIVGKNFWLTKIRWFYTFLIFLFFVLYNYISDRVYLNFRNFILILALSFVGNIIFILSLKMSLKSPSKKNDYNMFFSIASLQLDFDLVVLSLLVFFSGGFESPVVVLFIFYIMVSTFLIYYKKAFRNTLVVMILIVVIFFSKEGSFASSQKLTTMIAFNVVLLFSFFISSYLSKNLRENEKVLQKLLKKTRDLSITDGLTSLYNQSHFFKLLDTELNKSRRYSLPFSLILFDVDYFKNYNDNNGHIRGSKALKKIGGLMKTVFRSSDALAKYGGDEFVIILPNTDKVGAFLAADRLRETIGNEPFVGAEKQPTGTLTLSLGIAGYPDHGSTAEEILDKADKALYFAKEAGRNRTIIYCEDFDKNKKK